MGRVYFRFEVNICNMSKHPQLTSRKNRNEEKEIKIKISKAQYNKLLSSRPRSSKLINPLNQKDVYYDREDLYITNLNRGLRVRFHEHSLVCLEFKSLFYNPYADKGNPWFIEEITFPFPLESNNLNKLFSILVRLDLLSPVKATYCSPKLSHLFEVEQILSCADLKPMIVVNKKRVGYQDGKVQYVFDYIKGLGYFLEIESQQEDPLRILEKLNLDNCQIIRNGYNDMLAVDIPSYVSNDEKQRRFKKNPNWNILPSEKEMIEEILSLSK